MTKHTTEELQALMDADGSVPFECAPSLAQEVIALRERVEELEGAMRQIDSTQLGLKSGRHVFLDDPARVIARQALKGDQP